MVAAGPTETLTRVRLVMRPASRSFDSVSLPPLPESEADRRALDVAGRRLDVERAGGARREIPPGPVTRTS